MEIPTDVPISSVQYSTRRFERETATEDLSRPPPFIISEPNSKKADEQGLRDGKLIVDNCCAAIKLAAQQSKIQKLLADCGITKEELEIGITYFVNWAETQEKLLLHAKPTTPNQVQKLVKIIADGQTEECSEETAEVSLKGLKVINHS